MYTFAGTEGKGKRVRVLQKTANGKLLIRTKGQKLNKVDIKRKAVPFRRTLW